MNSIDTLRFNLQIFSGGEINNNNHETTWTGSQGESQKWNGTANADLFTFNSESGNDNQSTLSNATLTASAGDDTLNINGNATGNQIDAGDGNDLISITGTAKDNIISLGAGQDSLYFTGTSEGNSIYAGSGADYIKFESEGTEQSAKIFDFGEGDSINISGVPNGNAVDGDYVIGKVTIVGAAGKIKSEGLNPTTFYYDNPAGNYFSINGSVATSITGGAEATDANDTIVAENLSTSINAGAGDDIISVISGSGTVDGGEGADDIYIGNDAEVIIVGSGDVVSLGDNNWQVGDDTIHATGSDFSLVSAGEGLYSLAHFGNHFSIDGSTVAKIKYGTIATEYSDTIYAENLSTSIDARGGNDIISVMSGAGTVDGGSGADDIYLGTMKVTIVGSGDVVSLGNGNWAIGEDTIHGVEDGYSITSAGDNLFKIVEVETDDGSIIYGETDTTDDYRAPAVADESVGTETVGSSVDISWRELGLAIGTNKVTGDSIDTSVPNTVTINEDGEMVVVEDSSESDAVIEIDSDTNSANLVINGSSDRSYNLTFHGGTIVGKWNATMSSGHDDLHIGNILGGHFDGGDGKDYFHVTKNLQGNVTLTGGATNEDLESGNNFYAESSSVSSASNQNKVTITDVNFNATDVVLIDAGVENLTADFFGDAQFKNYATASDATTSGVYAGTVFDASDLVKNLGMSFSMLRMADKTEVTLDDENAIDEDLITNVVWANSDSATIDFSSTQTDDVLVFTNTNSKGDIVSLGGDFNDTIHAGADDTVDAGGGDDLIYLNRRNYVVFGSTEGNDTIYGWDSTDTLSLNSTPDVSISNGNLYLESDNGTLLIDGSFTNSTNIRYNLDGSAGIMRVGDSTGNVEYNKNVTYYAGSTLVINSSSNNTIDLSSEAYQNISVIDASGASGRDTFRYTSDAGDVTISNGDSKDVVDLSNYSVDEVSAEFTDNGLILTINDSNLNIVGTNLTTFSLASGKYTADFQNQTFNS